MKYEEAIKALKVAQNISWKWPDLSVHDGITQAIEVFRRIKVDLDAQQNLTSQCSGRDSPDAQKVAIGECPHCGGVAELKDFWLESRR